MSNKQNMIISNHPTIYSLYLLFYLFTKHFPT